MRTITAALVATVAIGASPDTARADRSDCSQKLERSYSKSYRQVARRHGTRAPGRNIRQYGVRFQGVTFDAVCSELRPSRSQLKQLMVSPPYSHSQAVPPPLPPAGVRSDLTVANGGSSNPMVNPACESGGNSQVVDPSGTYWGKYQFD